MSSLLAAKGHGGFESPNMVTNITEPVSNAMVFLRGYCEETGEKIGLKQLLIQPYANLSVEAQEHLEQRQRLSKATGLAVHAS